MDIEKVKRILISVFYAIVLLIIFIFMIIPMVWSSYEFSTISFSGLLYVDLKIIKLVFIAQIFQLLIYFLAVLMLFQKKTEELRFLKSAAILVVFSLCLISFAIITNYFFSDLTNFFNIKTPPAVSEVFF